MDGYYSEEFVALLNEAQFTKEILGIGVTQLYKANYAQKGIYYQSFICLATGLERIGKLCLILDRYIDDGGRFPEENYIRRHGHKLTGLYSSCREIAKAKGIGFGFPCVLEDSIHKSMIDILNSFAESSGRYHNINIVLKKQEKKDCIMRWKEEIDLALYEKRVSKRKKDKIEKNAEIAESLLGEISWVRHITETGGVLQRIGDASKETGIWEAVAPYRQLYMLQIIRFFVEVLMGLCHEARKIRKDGQEDIPYFSEVFAIFYNSDSYFKSRKTWNE